MSERVSGKCLCGGVSFSVPLKDNLGVCHCRTCQRWGGPFIEMDTNREELEFESEASLVWYDSSAWAQRGFCSTCGSNLFYRLKDQAHVAVLAGALDLPAALPISKEIFIDEKPDYYDLAGDRPRLTGAEIFAQFQESQS